MKSIIKNVTIGLLVASNIAQLGAATTPAHGEFTGFSPGFLGGCRGGRQPAATTRRAAPTSVATPSSPTFAGFAPGFLGRDASPTAPRSPISPAMEAVCREFGLLLRTAQCAIDAAEERHKLGQRICSNLMDAIFHNDAPAVHRIAITSEIDFSRLMLNDSPAIAAALILATLRGYNDIVQILLQVSGVFDLWHNDKCYPSSDTAVSQARDLAIELGHDDVVAVIDEALAKLPIH